MYAYMCAHGTCCCWATLVCCWATSVEQQVLSNKCWTTSVEQQVLSNKCWATSVEQQEQVLSNKCWTTIVYVYVWYIYVCVYICMCVYMYVYFWYILSPSQNCVCLEHLCALSLSWTSVCVYVWHTSHIREWSRICLAYIPTYLSMYVCIRIIYICICMYTYEIHMCPAWLYDVGESVYWVATVSRINKIICLFCRISSVL